jgi:hypothetical protein
MHPNKKFKSFASLTGTRKKQARPITKMLCRVNTGIMKTFAIIYAMLVFIIALWAWHSEIKYLHSSIEHLLPICLLSLISLPTSLSTGAMYKLFPELFNFPLLQTSWITICAVFQSSLIFLLSHSMNKKKSVHNK